MIISEQISQQKKSFIAKRNNGQKLERTIQLHIEAISQNEISSTNSNEVENLFLSLGRSIERNSSILPQYLNKLIPFIINSGRGIHFLEYLEKAIAHFKQENLNPCNLLLAKVKYLGLIRLEDKEIYQVLKEAEQFAETFEDKIKVEIEKSDYYTNISNYTLSIKILTDCLRDKTLSLKDLSRIYCGLGMNYFYIFQMNKAKEHFEKSLTLDTDDRIMSINLHYLGRVNLVKGHIQDAMEYYIKGFQYQLKCSEDAAAIAFWHIRMGELLSSQNLFEEAKYHFHESQALIKQIKSISSIQTVGDIAISMFYLKKKEYDKSENILENALKNAKNINFSRGVLLCYVQLFWLFLRQRKIVKSFGYFKKAMATLQDGELRNNLGIKLIIIYIRKFILSPFHILTDGGSYTFIIGKSKEKLTACKCIYHQ